MTSDQKEWAPCPEPSVSDTIRWKEPLWAKPNKPRGKPDKIGEQMITAKLVEIGYELLELEVIDVQRLSLMDGVKDAPSKVKPKDMIRRKLSSIERGECEKLLKE